LIDIATVRVLPHAAVLYAVLALPLLAVLMYVPSAMAAHFRCPHCAEQFERARTTWLGLPSTDPYTSRCKHCGIRMGTPRSAVEREQAALVEQSPSLAGEPRDDSERDLPDAQSDSQSA
jgi:hypothetical protein